MLHPALSLVLWSLLVLLGQLLTPPWLVGYSTIACLCASLLAARRFVRLLRRSRYLLLALAVLFGGFTPGELLMPDLPWSVLTREGAWLASIQVMRVGSVIALVAILLERVPSSDLVSGLACLARPLSLCGWSPVRLALRLNLVLQMVAVAESRSWRDWLDERDDDQPWPSVAMIERRFGWRDAVALVLVTVAGGLVWLHGA